MLADLLSRGIEEQSSALYSRQMKKMGGCCCTLENLKGQCSIDWDGRDLGNNRAGTSMETLFEPYTMAALESWDR